MEVGGLLYGTREGRTVRLLAIRPINCEHARGPAFQLSDADKEVLTEQIEHGPEDPRLADLICLGWFVRIPVARSCWANPTWRFMRSISTRRGR